MKIDRSLLVILAGVAAAVHVGKLPPALPALRDSLGISLLESGFLISLVQLAGMALGLAVGLAADTLGLRRTMLTGLALVSLASVAGAWARGAQALLFLRAVEGLGFLLASMPAPSLIRRLVAPQRLQFFLGLWGAYMPLATALALLIGPTFVAHWGWPAWWWVTAVPSGVMFVALWLAVPSDPRDNPAAGPASAWSARLMETLTAPGPWLVAVAFAVYSAQWLAVVGFLPSIYAQAGLSPVLAGLATALAAAVNMVGNISAGRLLQRRVAPRRLLQVGYATMGLASVLAFAPVWPAGSVWSVVGPYLAVLLFSMIGGLIPGTLFSLAVMLAPSPRSVSTTVGWMQQWSAIGQFAGPPLVALVATRAGGWGWSWVVTALCALLGFALTWSIGRLHGTVLARAA